MHITNTKIKFSTDTTLRTASKTLGETIFSPILKPFFNNAVLTARPLDCAETAKARQNGRGIWLYNASIRQGSSDFSSFSDDYNIFALRDSKPSLLNEPSQRIQTSLCFCASLWWHHEASLTCRSQTSGGDVDCHKGVEVGGCWACGCSICKHQCLELDASCNQESVQGDKEKCDMGSFGFAEYQSCRCILNHL